MRTPASLTNRAWTNESHNNSKTQKGHGAGKAQSNHIGDPWRETQQFCHSDFFKNSLGLFRGTGAAERNIIRVREDSWIKEYVTKYPIHPSQKSVDALHIELLLEINQELENFLLRYSTELQVVEPDHLREKMRANLAIAVSLYQ